MKSNAEVPCSVPQNILQHQYGVLKKFLSQSQSYCILSPDSALESTCIGSDTADIEVYALLKRY